MGWFSSKRERYEKEVLALIPGLGVDVRVAGETKTRGVVDVAWKQSFSSHEAALLIAHSTVVGLLSHGDKPSAVSLLYDSLEPVHREWVQQGVVRQDLAERWLSETVGIIGPRADAAVADNSQFRVTAELPNIVGKKPSRIFRFHSYAGWFLRDLPEVGHGSALETKNAKSVYRYVLAVTKQPSKEFAYFAGLRSDAQQGAVVWLFYSDGSRKTWPGMEQLLGDEEGFIFNSLTLVCRELKLPETWEEMPVA